MFRRRGNGRTASGRGPQIYLATDMAGPGAIFWLPTCVGSRRLT